MAEARSTIWAKWIYINAGVAAWLIYDMATATEYPSQALAILQYALLALTLMGLAGSVVKYMSEK